MLLKKQVPQLLRTPGRVLATVFQNQFFNPPNNNVWLSPINSRCLYISNNGVERGEQFPGDGAQRQLGGFSRLSQTLVEDLEGVVVARGAQSCEVEGSAHAMPAVAQKASPFPLAGLSGDWSESG